MMGAGWPSWRKQTPNGWADERLMQVYDLVHEIWVDHNTEEDILSEIRKLLLAIERADDDLAAIIKGRVS